MYALVDCNNFYVSCERAFNPALVGIPVVVLSNNDGCIVARSNEAKALGVAMAAPYFTYKELLQRQGVVVFSSNYQLYGDMSSRVMRSLRMLTPEVEVYSIDEAFLRFDGLSAEAAFHHGCQLRQAVGQWTGIPVSCGIAPTRTLAKVANHVAKKRATSGVFDMSDPATQQSVLSRVVVEDIWGVSGRWGQTLRCLGISTALALRDADAKYIRRHMGVIGERLVYELRGISCVDSNDVRSRKKSIMSSRSFGARVTGLVALQEALSSYAVRACEKLRKQGSKALAVSVSIYAGTDSQKPGYYRNSASTRFDLPTANTSVIIAAAALLLDQLYREGFRYKKIGIRLLDLVAEDAMQKHLFSNHTDMGRDGLMQAIDRINKTMGTGTVFPLAQGIQQSWAMRSHWRSPRYTTNWQELPLVV